MSNFYIAICDSKALHAGCKVDLDKVLRLVEEDEGILNRSESLADFLRENRDEAIETINNISNYKLETNEHQLLSRVKNFWLELPESDENKCGVALLNGDQFDFLRTSPEAGETIWKGLNAL